jgi:hypothetical protein
VSLPIEQWRPIPGFEGSYEVSDLGRVRSVDRFVATRRGTRSAPGRILRPHPDRYGRPWVSLCIGGERKIGRIHRLVLEAFVGPCPPGMFALHADDDRTNNRLANLRWGTRVDNQRDAVANGRHACTNKTHCPRGHAYSGPNLQVKILRSRNRPEPRRQRTCRACTRAISTARKARVTRGVALDIDAMADRNYARIMGWANDQIP